jgi:patatin-related protein
VSTTEELRIAVAMSGGVSLAIWMGGVAKELDRLRRGESAYAPLLELMGQQPVVDLVSGTSAGGLNGALLGAAIAGDRGLDGLRALWVDKGDFRALLRSPSEPDPPSLLRGDAYFLRELYRAFADLLPSAPRTDDDFSHFKLFTTVTLMRGRARRFEDSLGTPLDELEHRGTLCFRAPHFARAARPVPGAVDANAAALALAARSSASYPIAFEPSLVPVGEPGDDPFHPDMAAFAWWRESGFALDGGLVLNRPVRPLIQAIPDQPPAIGSVRRLLLYVSPNPPGRLAPDPSLLDPPTLLDVGAAIAGAIASQSIADDLEAIRAHNEQVDRRRRLDAALHALTDEQLAPLAALLREQWCERRGRLFARRVVRRLVERGAIDDVVRLADDDLSLAARLADRHEAALRAALDVDTAQVLAIDSGPVDRALRAAQWLARNALRTNAAAGAAEQLAERRAELGRARAELAALDERVLATWADGVARALADGAAIDGLAIAPASGEAMAEIASRAHDARAAIAGLVLQDGEAVATYAEQAVAIAEAPTVAPARPAADPLWRQVCDEAIAVQTSAIGNVADVAPDVDPAIAWASAALSRLAGTPRTVTDPARRAVLVDIASAALLDDEGGDEPIALVQVSANAPNAFDGRARPDEKLTGLQLHHFGAFHKPSWRANDWMWGRLDGAHSLVEAVLDPARLRRSRFGPLPPADPNAVHAIAREIVRGLAAAATGLHLTGVPVADDGVDPATLARLVDAAERAGVRDVHFLTRDFSSRWSRSFAEVLRALEPDGRAEHLRGSVEWVARRLQLGVLRDELLELAACARNDPHRGDVLPRPLLGLLAAAGPYLAPAPGTTGARRATTPVPVPDADTLVEIFRACHVGEELLAGEVTTARFADTATHALATTVGALSGSRSPAVVRPVAAGLRGITRAIATIARLVADRSQIAFAALAVMITLSASVVALAVIERANPLPWIAWLALALLLSAAVVGLFRKPGLIGGGLVVAVTLLLWGSAGLALVTRYTDVGQLAAATLGAVLLIGLLTYGAGALLAPDGRWRRAGAVVLVLLVAGAAYAGWRAVDGIAIETDPDAACPAPDGDGRALCVVIEDRASARAAALVGGAVVLVLVMWLVVRRWRTRTR